MQSPYLNIIALNTPYPANYGGVIDIFYKLTSLHKEGVKIILHCFDYGRGHSKVLEDLCEEVYYYKRKTGALSFLSPMPYIVNSRRSDKLKENLLKNDYPILFEGLHTCFLLTDPAFKDRLKIVRACNVEHEYYRYLAEQEQSSLKKIYFRIESRKLLRFERKLRVAQHILAISPKDKIYFQQSYPKVQVSFIPGFHEYEKMDCKEGKGEFLLYHGNLSVHENETAAMYLIPLAERLPMPLIIAGLAPSTRLAEEIRRHKNVKLLSNLEQKQMEQLIEDAHAHVLVTFQDTGLKLKLLHALFSGRYIIANGMMVDGTGLEDGVIRADNEDEIVAAVESVAKLPFGEEALEQRRKILVSTYTNARNAKEIVKIIAE